MGTVHELHQSMIEAAKEMLRENGWAFEEVDGHPVLRLSLQGENGSWNCFAHANEDPRRLSFYSVLPTNVPGPRRLAAAEFLTRANSGLAVGNFELNFDTGEVRYKTSAEFNGGKPPTEVTKRLAYINVLTADRYLPGLMQVVFTGTSPADAVASIEAK